MVITVIHCGAAPAWCQEASANGLWPRIQPTVTAGYGCAAPEAHLCRSRTDQNQPRPPGLREALAACRQGDMLVVAKLDRLARSVPDARGIVDELTNRGVKRNLGGSVHDPTDPVGRLLFNVLAMVTREGTRKRATC